MTNKILGVDRHQECRSLKWMSDMTTLQVYVTIFQQMLQNYLLKIYIISSTLPSQTTTSTQNKKKKIKEKIEFLIQQVVGNSGALLFSFQESTNIMKNINNNFAALLEKF